MMQHKTLENGRWAELPFIEQMANIGSEVGRTYSAKKRGDAVRAEKAFERALELFDLTKKYGRLNDPDRGAMLKEVCRLREVFCKDYLSSDPQALAGLDKYFFQFAVAARLRRHNQAPQR